MLAVLDMKPHSLVVLALILMLLLNVPLTIVKMLELFAFVSTSIVNLKSIFVFCIAIYPVRLSDGTASSGRVEILFNGRWGTVCDDNFGKLDGKVVCRQLNLGDISRIANPMEFSAGTNDQPIWLDEVQCTGDERWLSSCPHPGYGDNDCFHSEDVGIVCTGETNKSLTFEVALNFYQQESKQIYQYKE